MFEWHPGHEPKSKKLGIGSLTKTAKNLLSRAFSRFSVRSSLQPKEGNDARMHLRNEKPNGIKKMVAVVVALTAIVFFGSYLLGYSTVSFFVGWEWFRKLCGFALFVAIGRLWTRDAISYLASQMVFYVPEYHFGVKLAFGARKEGYLLEGGPYFKWPDFMERTEHVSLELDTTPEPITIKFVTKDKLSVAVRGSLQFRPDPEVVNEKGRVVYLEMSDDIIIRGISETIQAKLGGLGGLRNEEDLVSRRQAIEEVINHLLRLGKPMHLRHDSNCGIQAGDIFVPCLWQGIEQIDADDILDFYNAHWRVAKAEKDKEKECPEIRSEIELRYGIDIEFFALAEVGFDEETKKALAVQKQAELRQKGFKTTLELVENAIQKGVSPEAAFNAAHVALNPDIARGKKIVSFEGLGQGATPVVVLGDLGGGQGMDGEGQEKTPTANTQKKGKKGGIK